MSKWKCKISGFVYDEDKGLPDKGIEPGTSFDSLPDDFKCPACGAGKFMFKEI